MVQLNALVVGGTGIISTACVHEAVRLGHHVTVINRGTGAHGRLGLPPGVEMIQADAHDADAVRAALGERRFDVVATFMAFVPDDVRRDIALFAGRTAQYIFVSSASAYQTPPAHLPVTESTPLHNPFWQYSRDKAACEAALLAAYREADFPVTIVRPSHTYDPTLVPFDGGWTVVERMRRGAPVVVPGDGTSLWTITHHTDFARAFVGLWGQRRALGHAVHITSDEAPSWNEIYAAIAAAAGAEPRYVHVPSQVIAAVDPGFGASLLGDKANSMVFDNTLIKRLVPGWTAAVPFAHGAKEIIAWHDADPGRRTVDPRWDALFDRLAGLMPRFEG
jgi:nucleoside-diphosphate-sugar epimerase